MGVPMEFESLSVEGFYILGGVADPSVTGVDAPVGSVYFHPSGLYRKYGPLPTDWRRLTEVIP